MKVSPSTNTTASQTPVGGSALLKRSSSFDLVLEKKKAEAGSRQKRRPATEGEEPALASSSAIAGVPFVLPFEAENTKSSHVPSPGGAIRSTQIQNIAGEIVSQVRSATNKDGSRSLEIEFDSKTLQGLQVRISEQQGSLNIQFSTQSENVAALLADHKADLVIALASDGFKTGTISTLVRSKQSGSDRGRGGQRGGQG
jgi:flagellar hook-length control protein FliK